MVSSWEAHHLTVDYLKSIEWMFYRIDLVELATRLLLAGHTKSVVLEVMMCVNEWSGGHIVDLEARWAKLHGVDDTWEYAEG